MLVCRLCELLPKLLVLGRVMLLQESCKAKLLLRLSKAPTVKSDRVLQTSALGCWLSLKGAISHRMYAHVLFAADHIAFGMNFCICLNPFEVNTTVASKQRRITTILAGCCRLLLFC